MEWVFSIGKFYGIDSAIEFLTIIVCLIIGLYSLKIYKLLNNKSYKMFSFAFFLLAISFLFKIGSNLTLVHRVVVEHADFVFTFFSQLKFMQLFNFISFLTFKALNIMGFLLLFLVLTDKGKKSKEWLLFYLTLLVVFLSVFFNFVFYATLVFILVYLTLYFYENYKKRGNTNSLLVFLSFLIILTSNLFFIFSDVHALFYLIAELILLIGFSLLLFNQIKLNNFVKKNETKKNKARNNKRFA